MKNQSASEAYQVRAIAVFITLLAGLIVITPVCGLLFQCNCDWPWLRFYFDCNYFNPEAAARHKCPWCNSDLAALGSIGTAFILAVPASLFSTGKASVTPAKAVALKVACGLTVFVAASSLLGTLAAYDQHYPLGVGGLFRDNLQVNSQ